MALMTAVPSDRSEATRALEHEFGVVLRRVRRKQAARAKMVHPELPAASYSMLTALYESGPRRSSELADLFAIDKGAVSRQVARLERLGLVTRQTDPDDGRAQLLSLTDLGRERLAEVARRRREWYDDRLSDWSVAEIAHLAEELGRYNGVLD